MDVDENPPTPTPTVYVNNINERIRGEKLLRGLRQAFGVHGKIHKIHARKSLKLRGQAFVVYEDLKDAEAAVAKLQGFSFYGKPLKVAFANTPSDHTLRKAGEKPEQRPAHPKKGMVAVKLEKLGTSGSRAVPKATTVATPFVPAFGAPVPPPPKSTMPRELPPAMPHNVLFLEGLPAEATEDMLSTLFSQYPGFQGVRMVTAKACAFVDYGSEPEATVAIEALNGFKLSEEHALKVSYARK